MAINSFAENLKKFLLLNPFRRRTFCLLLNTPSKTITDWALGREEPDIDTLIRIAALFHISIDELVCGEYHPPERELKAPELLLKTLGKKGELTSTLSYEDMRWEHFELYEK